jgi:hypothetical protein
METMSNHFAEILQAKLSHKCHTEEDYYRLEDLVFETFNVQAIDEIEASKFTLACNLIDSYENQIQL